MCARVWDDEDEMVVMCVCMCVVHGEGREFFAAEHFMCVGRGRGETLMW